MLYSYYPQFTYKNQEMKYFWKRGGISLKQQIKDRLEVKQKISDRIEKINKDIVPEGYKQTKICIIPGDCEVKNIETIRNKDDRYSYAGGPFGSNLKVSDFTRSGIRVLQLQNIGDGYFANKHKVYTSV